MTKEEKKLLIKDLCARLPYEPVIEYVVKGLTGNGHITCKLDVFHIDELLQDSDSLVDVKPYLRPMSSMTEKEKRTLQSFYPMSFGNQYLDLDKEKIELYECNSTMVLDLYDSVQIVDFCKKNHLDCYGLIEKELAIEVTEKNNPYKE